MLRQIGLALGLLSVCAAAVRADWLTEASARKLTAFDGTQVSKKDDSTMQRRGKVTLRRIKPQCKSDWDNDPTSLPYYIYQLQQRTDGKYPCYVDNRGISLLGEEIYDYPVIYFTSHLPFTFTDDEVENLKKYLARGGTLLLDDCTGSGPFMDSVPANVQRICPGIEMELMLRESKDYADLFSIVYKLDGMPHMKEQFMQPFQAGKINGRPALLFCPNDYGCDWEVAAPPTPLNPLGDPAHADNTPTVQRGREEVYQLSINWLFYALTH